MRRSAICVVCLVVCAGIGFAANPPQAEISNQHIKAKIYLPDAQKGFYRGTRFDWSGVISSLEYQGHNYYGPWFTKFDPSVRDFLYQGGDIIAGAASAVTGPADEFQKPLGYAEAKAGGTFVKIGVGVLRKPDDANYVAFRKYDIVDSGKWDVRKAKDFVEFTQTLQDAATGYGYLYRKIVRLTAGKPEMTIEHNLRNTGRMPIRTNVYNHNFLVLDNSGPGPDMVITFPFEIRTPRLPEAELAEITGTHIAYRKALAGEDRVFFPIQGFGPDAKDYDIRIERKSAGAGMRITGDRPLSAATLWSIRSVMAIEPFIDISADPGRDFSWKYTYAYYSLP